MEEGYTIEYTGDMSIHTRFLAVGNFFYSNEVELHYSSYSLDAFRPWSEIVGQWRIKTKK
jgi:hypothetical protein